MIIVNNLIAADDLHWYEDDKRFCVISSKEMVKILEQCHKFGIRKESDMTKMFRWIERIKTQNLLLKKFFKGDIRVDKFNGNEPVFRVLPLPLADEDGMR